MGPVQVKHAWAERGYDFTLWTDPPGQIWADFVHDVDELVLLLAGNLELSFLGQTVRPQVGEEVFIPAGVRHTVRNIGTTPNRWCYGYKARQ
ncbi:MAG TPA: cupin domain-containing protein [Candidatus Tectomicrobia bacterium]|jgi:quercetin dioxygenase-like cupin family protein